MFSAVHPLRLMICSNSCVCVWLRQKWGGKSEDVVERANRACSAWQASGGVFGQCVGCGVAEIATPRAPGGARVRFSAGAKKGSPCVCECGKKTKVDWGIVAS
eukprot:TRINITY_DN15672_c0_g1_i1.p2 TRINITY_DN15672_c0_g1~~TRINITY_DN15672_c0_g1_i1.p2  ORF type:complete len:103 (+),score=10.40 TRINITY_DN15672_c0_g1_i1:128-436(+)